MSGPTKGSNFFIVPGVDKSAMNKAEAEIYGLVQKASRAVEQGNERVLQNVSSKLAAKLGKEQPKVTVDVEYRTDSATGSIKEIRTLSAGALDPMVKDYKKMVGIQGESALKVKQELAIQGDKLASLRQQATTLNKKGAAYKRNLQSQRDIIEVTGRYEEILKRVTTLASAKGQLRAESQKLSMMSKYNVGLNQQGKLVEMINPKWVAQKQLVAGLSRQVTLAGLATQGFGAKVAAAGTMMQAAFGWIAAVTAGLMAVAGAVGVITGRAKDVQAMRLTFDGLGQSLEAQNAILDRSKNIALSYGVSLRKVEGAFKRLGPAILESGGSLANTDSAIQSIAARTTMLGLNTEQTGRYIEAFAQVMGKGKLQSEELNQQFSELDGGLRGQLKNWLAATKGITDFEGAMKKGEITSGIFLEAFEAINEEIRNKFLRSIGDTQQAISDLGKEGKLTLNQLNAQLQTLTSIGFESLGERLAPLGRELMKIYAAFVQIFTKIETEMPGLKAGISLIGQILGVGLKVAINTILVLIHDLMSGFDKLFTFVQNLYNKIKNVPGLGHILEGFEGMLGNANTAFDKFVDNTARLSEETIGAKANLEQYANKAQELANMLDSGQITREEFNKQMHENETNRLSQLVTQLQSRFDTESANRKTIASEAEQHYDKELAKVKEIYNEKVAAIDAEIAALRKKTPAEERLYQIRKQELQAAIRKGGLSEKELVSKKAQLERMEAQEKIDVKLVEKGKEKNKFAKKQKTLQEEMNQKIKDQDSLLEDIKTSLDAAKTAVEAQATAGDQFETALDGVATSTGEAATNLSNTESSAATLQGHFDNAATGAGSMATNIQQAALAQERLNTAIKNQPAPPSNGSGNRASGGPVTGGKTYTVNELGMEGFMSSSGKLSQINAPSWGTWKAPSSGTVIPAHIWQSLKASQASAVAMPKTVSPGNSVANAISTISNSSGDSYNNSVTIQAANPVQAANNIMVEMTRLKRRRFR